jgi:hypothetical protein
MKQSNESCSAFLFFTSFKNINILLSLDKEKSMQDFKITIPKPCHEDWDKMSPNEKGKHCCVCEKTVVDFTAMEPQEIKSFFEAKKGEKVCGHFKTEQVDKHIPKFHQWLMKVQSTIENNFRVPVFGKMALGVVGFSMFVMGCSSNTKGKVKVNDSNSIDSVKCSTKTYHTTGVIDIPIEKVETILDSTKSFKSDTVITVINGDVNYEEK